MYDSSNQELKYRLSKVYNTGLNPELESYERKKNEEIKSIFSWPNLQNCLKVKRLEKTGHVWWQRLHKVLVNTFNG